MKQLSILASLMFFCSGPIVAQTQPRNCSDLATKYSGDPLVEAMLNCIEEVSKQLAVPTNAKTEIEVFTPTVVGWAGYAPFGPFRYWKSAEGVVHLDGLMSGCPQSDGVIFTLPKGYRPKNHLVFPQIGTDNLTVRVDIKANGIVNYHWSPVYGHNPTDGADSARNKCQNAGNARRWMSLTGISFLAAD